MEGLWKKLIEILEKESGLYKDILELSRHKTNTIVEGKVAELEQITRVEQKMLLNIGGLEQQREDAVNQLARSLNVPADQLSIDLAIDKVGADLKERLVALKDDIAAQLKELKQVNDLNSQLIEKSLEYIDFSINLIAGSPSDVTYNTAKGKGKDKGVSFFDQKV